jgi:hypothetical protein
MADVVLFQVDAHPVELAGKLGAFAFGVVIGNRHRQIDAYVERFVGWKKEPWLA